MTYKTFKDALNETGFAKVMFWHTLYKLGAPVPDIYLNYHYAFFK